MKFCVQIWVHGKDIHSTTFYDTAEEAIIAAGRLAGQRPGLGIKAFEVGRTIFQSEGYEDMKERPLAST